MKYLVIISIALALLILYNLERDIASGVSLMAARTGRETAVIDSLRRDCEQAWGLVGIARDADSIHLDEAVDLGERVGHGTAFRRWRAGK